MRLRSRVTSRGAAPAVDRLSRTWENVTISTVECHLLEHDGEDLSGEDCLLLEAYLYRIGNFPNLNELPTNMMVHDQYTMANAPRNITVPGRRFRVS